MIVKGFKMKNNEFKSGIENSLFQIFGGLAE